MKKLLLICLCFLMVSCSNPSKKPITNNDKDIKVLFTNDVHCGVSDEIGYAGLKFYKDSLTTDNYVALVDCGDAIQGAPIGTLTKGEDIIGIMNYVGYDFAVPGNHEFDYGFDTFKQRIGELNCGYYSANLMDLSTNKAYLNPYKIMEFGNGKVALVGVSTPESFTKSTPVYFQDENGNYLYSFCEDDSGKALYDAVQKAVDSAIKEGANAVVLVSHLGNEGISQRWTSREVIANTTGIDVVLDGHSHETVAQDIVKNKNGEDVILSQTGTKLNNIGELTISKDGSFSTKLVTKEDLNLAEDFSDEYIKGVEDKFQVYLKEVVGNSEHDLTINDENGNRIVRNSETNLGDFIADAYKTVLDADVGIINAGGIRASIKKGDVTYGDVLTVAPFNNMGTVVIASGQQIKDALEHGASVYPEENGGFLQVSGITYTINSDIASSVIKDDKNNFVKVDGEYRVSDIMINGEPLDLEKMYKVASINYILKNGGDGYTMFAGSEVIKDEVLPDVDVIVDYMKANGTASYSNPLGEGRITIK